MMNQYSKGLGMLNSNWINATGLPDPEHYTTPRDIVLVTEATIREFPELYRLYAVKEFTYNEIRQHNRNNLLWRDDSVDGVKTGHTEAAGYCLVASARQGDMRLISVVMGTDGENARARESQKLLNYGFRFFETHKLYDAGTPLTTTRIWKGATDTATLGLDEALYVTIPRGQYKSLDASMSINNRIIAPVAAGQDLGTVQVKLGEEIVADLEKLGIEVRIPRIKISNDPLLAPFASVGDDFDQVATVALAI